MPAALVLNRTGFVREKTSSLRSATGGSLLMSFRPTGRPALMFRKRGIRRNQNRLHSNVRTHKPIAAECDIEIQTAPPLLSVIGDLRRSLARPRTVDDKSDWDA